VSLALLFAGQGTQYAAMLPWLEACPEAAPGLALITAQLGGDWRNRLAEPEWAQSNAVAQPMLTGLSLAAWHGLAPSLPVPAVVAGYSVGELAAFCVAGVFSVVDAMGLAVDRAAAMDRSAAGLDTGLLSVQGLDAKALQAACARYGLSMAIRLAADRAVLGGLSEALVAAERGLSADGVRCTRLPVRVASHTPWMSAAAVEFEARLSAVPLSSPRTTLVCNHIGAAERDPGRLRQLLARQVATTVLWDSCMDAIAERRVRCVLEVGAGHALTNLWRDRHPDVPVRSVDEFRSAYAIARWVNTALR
jgi:[acyl-carrier-protein] S-malonyltransferase